MNNTKALEAQSRINQAQEDEAKARKAGNPLAVDEAVARKTRAEDDLYAALQPEHEETVTLLAPNSEANVTDAGGVTLAGGVAEGVPRSLAERYAREFKGYEIQEQL
jgi:hypothetical protein